MRTYVRPPRCRYCKSLLRPDKRGTHKERQYTPCRCDGYSFGHRPGSKFCIHNTSTTGEDHVERYERGGWS